MDEPRTMNEADAHTKHEYDHYMLEVMQLEWEHTQVQNVGDEHTNANATQVAADPMMHDEGDVVNLHDVREMEADMKHDLWVEELYAAEELERAQRELEERRDDH